MENLKAENWVEKKGERKVARSAAKGAGKRA